MSAVATAGNPSSFTPFHSRDTMIVLRRAIEEKQCPFSMGRTRFRLKASWQTGWIKRRGKQQPEEPGNARLRLDCDDARAEAAEAGGAVADMRADIEGEITGIEEAAIERIEDRGAFGAVVEPQRTADREPEPLRR